mgnify:CR=1 FL=1
MALASNSASAETAAKIKNFNWRPVMDAITQVESKGNAKAKNGPHAGILQISHHVVAECNNILKAKGSKKRYTMADRFSPEKSRDVCSVPVKIQQGKQYGASHSHVAWRNKLQQEQNATVLQQGEEVFEKLNKPQNASSKVPM